MAHIESYRFGRMVIDGSTYTGDVLIFPDGRIHSPWWRSQGHVLGMNDMTDLVAAGPEVIVCGTGAMGVMQPAPGLQEYLAAKSIEFIALKSAKAVEVYNSLAVERKTGGCFHLTC